MVELGSRVRGECQYLFILLFVDDVVMKDQRRRTVCNLEREQRLVARNFRYDDEPFEVIFKIVGADLDIPFVETGQKILSHLIGQTYQ